MNKRRIKRAVVITGLVGLLLAAGFGLWLRSDQRQEALNRQLIAALVKQDPKQAFVLVNAGADPNTPFERLPPPFLTQLWNLLIHSTALPHHDTSAFHAACGAFVPPGDYAMLEGLHTDEPHLIETMLQHGAQKSVNEGHGTTPFFWSVLTQRPKTIDVLLNHGVNVNAQNNYGETALVWFIMGATSTSFSYTPSERSRHANTVRQLLAHGADPNLPSWNGITPLQVAQEHDRPDIVALLKQAGAKK